MKTALRAGYLRRALKLCCKPGIAPPRRDSSERSPQSFTRSTLSLFIAVPAAFLVALGGDHAQAQVVTSFRTLYSFTNGTDGETPEAGLVLSGSTLYGAATGGGATGNGSVFSINTDGSDFRVLYAFSAASLDQDELVTNFDGSEPRGGVLLFSNTLYGTTYRGGTTGVGTVYAVNTDGTGFTNLHNFNGYDGGGSYTGLIIQGSTLYGTSTDFPMPNGNIFAVNTDGTGSTAVHFFGGDDGGESYGGLILSGPTLYGTTSGGGTNGGGTAFGVNTNGTGFSVLHSFANSPDGSDVAAGLVQSGNTLYGTAALGGIYSNGTMFAVSTNGTAFTVLHSFNGMDGNQPSSTLILSGNTLYGTTVFGGEYGTDQGPLHDGTVFAVNTDGTGFTVIHNFQGSDGAVAYGGLVMSGKTLYGTTWAGGTSGAGTIFAITLPSGPAIYPSSVAEVGGQLQFVAGGLTAGATVVLQASSDPSPAANWVPVATNTATGANMSFSGLCMTNANNSFFRVLETSPP
jgi:uncharacterized repeat protein (TIGR03803 family)